MKKLLLGLQAALFCALLSTPVRGEGEFLSSLEKDVTNLVSLIKPSLVTINTLQTVKTKAPGPSSKKGIKSYQFERVSRIGSGVIFDQQGYVITSASVVSGGDAFEVQLTDGRKFKGELAGQDPGLNLAVLKIEASGLTPARLGNSDLLKPGSWTIVLGNSYGLPSAVAVGLFNGTRPDGFLQLSASVAPGNSGGPVLNSRGEVIGLVSAKVSEASSFSILTEKDGSQVRIAGSQGVIDMPSAAISLAIPINRVKRSAQQIVVHGSVQKGFLGVYLEETRSGEGVYISDIVDNSPADKAGIKPGDVIILFSGKRVTTTDEFRKLVEEALPQSQVSITVLRDKNPVELAARLGKAEPVSALLFPEFDASVFSGLSRLKDLQVDQAVPESPYNPFYQQIAEEELHKLFDEYQEKFETQKGAGAYKSAEMEKRMAVLERQLELYRKALDSLRFQLQQVKASQAP